MEKVIASLYGATVPDPSRLAALLKAGGASSVRINLRDDSVAPAAALAQKRGEHLPNAVVQFWLASSNDMFRSEIDGILDDCCEQRAAWLVSESTIIPNTAHPPSPGHRTEGFAQLAFLTLPDGQSWDDWRRIWRDSHTQIAIDTQSNFEYIQNLVIEPLTADAPPFVAIVEECFPIEAMTDAAVFFDAVGEPTKFEANLKTMMDSCARFITPGTIDVIPSSQFDFR